MMAAAGARQNMAPELNPHDECGDLSGEFDARCRISVHYASTPTAMGGDNNGKREELHAEDRAKLQKSSELQKNSDQSQISISEFSFSMIPFDGADHKSFPSNRRRLEPQFAFPGTARFNNSMQQEGGGERERERERGRQLQRLEVHPRRVDENCSKSAVERASSREEDSVANLHFNRFS